MLRSSFQKIILTAIAAAMPLLAGAKPSKNADESSLVLYSGNKQLNQAIQEIIATRPPVDDFGVVLANIHDFPQELVRSAKSELKFSDRLQVISIEKDSLADQLGLKPGDQLLQINSFYVSRGQAALQQFVERVEPAVEWDGEINTTIIRNGFGQNHSTASFRNNG
ncbi:hypothetical protein IEN85_12430 [Pelagicoccus sp. NFK12]|uniref:PDZ domain-containing protein n=1 Tax=Pelagicoccus enzymogenes TaxID=2773457 RepID=A0A927IHK6_9BACT|nr:hypothetical protein [Pelagicoccus enzymogenes]MBD5780301.1 hypothetical protein [Pelagicoccus enzymogenes]MDQ8197796.1 hypothetical protein [Pelagicoccus enzymogenes]